MHDEEQPAPLRTPAAKRVLRRLAPPSTRYQARQRLIDNRLANRAMTRLDPNLAISRITPQTELVIDGFPRSGNSYARAAFMYSNPGVPISTHGHSYRFPAEAVRRGLPAIVVIREPRGPLASVLQFADVVHPRVLLREYCRFYEHVIPLLDQVIISTFDRTTSDFGSAIAECNARFGTSFAPFVTTADSDAAVKRMIDADARRVASGEIFESVVPRPSAHRGSADEALATLDRAGIEELARATEVYERLIAGRRRTAP